jgi:phosphopantothenoylcysteine synthetase/decarboxylase
MGLRRKKILITAGPTWAPIDSVRVISNIATGKTGMLLAREARNRGARVTLVLGPCGECKLDKSIRIIRFSFFKELKDILKHELKGNKYDIVIHSAAVSDFRPEYKIRGKLSSDRAYGLKLLPLDKLIVLIRRLKPKAKLVMFKLESGAQNRTLIQRAKSAGYKFGADLVVANRLSPYRAFIIGRNGSQVLAKSKQGLAKKLINILNRN